MVLRWKLRTETFFIFPITPILLFLQPHYGAYSLFYVWKSQQDSESLSYAEKQVAPVIRHNNPQRITMLYPFDFVVRYHLLIISYETEFIHFSVLCLSSLRKTL